MVGEDENVGGGKILRLLIRFEVCFSMLDS